MNRLWLRLAVAISMTAVSSASGYAQINLIYNANAYGKNIRELAYLQIMNSTAQIYSGSLVIEVRNASNNEMLVKIGIPSLTINPGNNPLPASKLNAAEITYTSGTEGNYIRQTNMMPEGELEYCFKLLASSKGNPDEVYENCFYRNNLIASPLQLTEPENLDSFCNKRPRFAWQPPMPLQAGTSFDFKLVKLNEGQNASEALLVNIPLVYQQKIMGFIMPYPASAPDLEEGSYYAWQVTAVSAGRQTLSEIWSFSIGCEKPAIEKGSFRELKSIDDGGFLITGSTLRVAIDNSFGAQPMNYSIKDLSSPEKEFGRLPSIRLDNGINNISIDLNKIPGIEEEHEYLLMVTMPGGRKVSLRFKYKENND